MSKRHQAWTFQGLKLEAQNSKLQFIGNKLKTTRESKKAFGHSSVCRFCSKQPDHNFFKTPPKQNLWDSWIFEKAKTDLPRIASARKIFENKTNFFSWKKFALFCLAFHSFFLEQVLCLSNLWKVQWMNSINNSSNNCSNSINNNNCSSNNSSNNYSNNNNNSSSRYDFSPS